MQLSLCGDIRLSGVIGVFEQTKKIRFPFSLYCNVVAFTLFYPSSAKYSRSVINHGGPLVFTVDLPGYVSEIFNAIIVPSAIDVVNLMLRPFTVNP